MNPYQEKFACIQCAGYEIEARLRDWLVFFKGVQFANPLHPLADLHKELLSVHEKLESIISLATKGRHL